MRGRVFALALLCAAGCGPSKVTGPRDTGLDGLLLTKIDPGMVVHGSQLVVTGQSFVDASLGTTSVHFTGTVGEDTIDATLVAVYVSESRLTLLVDDDFVTEFGGALAGTFEGMATVAVKSTVDNKTYETAPIGLRLELRDTITPRLDAVGDGLSFVNQPIELSGDGFLLGGDEGETRAALTGCFTRTGMTGCGPNMTVEIPGTLLGPFDRTRLSFPYATSISGIFPGTFAGTLVIKNLHKGGMTTMSASKTVRFDIQKPTILGASPTRASLGQYVVIRGGGFVGGEADEATTLGLVGNFTPAAGGAARALDLELVVEFKAGPEVRYVLDESTSEPLARVIDLRKEPGTIRGTVKPIVAKGRDRIEGDPIQVVLGIEPVKQVVFINYQPSYVASLRKFGLRAADPAIRARVLEVARRDYEGVNIEFRDSRPDDFALYAEVDIGGVDPNGLGLLGYDNSPGKDTDNLRLYDRIGGVNALTQQDGYPGFGGVFIDSFFAFSEHPPIGKKQDQATPDFDTLIDPFRADRGGVELTASELAKEKPPVLDEGSRCPGDTRQMEIACAIFVFGSLIGTTTTHEIGHSLGLANPYGEGFHDPGDGENRLMDSGGARTFPERAELQGQGPSVFCDEEYDYLRKILPSADSAPAITRPSCN